MITERFMIPGPKGRLQAILQLPDGFDRTRDRCTVVILMHGIMPNPVTIPLPHFARALVNSGYAALRFFFYGNWGSDGTNEEVTVPGEIEDARAVYRLVRSWPFADKVVLLGHSQGGVVAGMLAGQLACQFQQEAAAPPDGSQPSATESDGPLAPPDALILLSPGAVLKDYAREGRLFGLRVDPENPPERKRVLWYTIGRDYILTAQTLPIYETSALYTGPVCICHGTIDRIVPFRYSERYAAGYADARLHPIPGANHFYSFRRRRVDALLLAFLRARL
jgi:alpha/beta superfamily hydrolase